MPPLALVMYRNLTALRSRLSLGIVIATTFVTACEGKGDVQNSRSAQNAGTCADPVALGSSSELREQSTANGADGVSGDDETCVGFATHGAERVYVLTVPAESKTKLHVEVSPEGATSADAFDPAIYLSEVCTATPKCVAGQDMRGAGGMESLEFVNSSGQEKHLYLVVDGYDFQPKGGAYKVATSLSEP